MMQHKHLAVSLPLSLIALAVSATTVRAEIVNEVIGIWSERPAGEGNEGQLFVNFFVYLWDVIMIIGGLIVLFFFIQAAIEWITAGGDSGKIQKARDRLIQSAIGLFILVFSFIIINFVGALLFQGEFNLLKFELPTAGAPSE